MEQNREIDQFKRQCSSRLADIYFHLFPAGKVIGTEFVIGDLDGSRGQSVSFSLDPSKNGVGGEFNTSDKNSEYVFNTTNRFFLNQKIDLSYGLSFKCHRKTAKAWCCRKICRIFWFWIKKLISC